jgi:hypothetical protein
MKILIIATGSLTDSNIIDNLVRAGADASLITLTKNEQDVNIFSYDVLLISTIQQGFKDPNVFGDQLADFCDNGGGLVLCQWTSWRAPFGIMGRFFNEKYHPLYGNVDYTPSTSAMMPVDKMHPILHGVKTFVGGANGRSTCAPNGYLIAKYNDGLPLIVENRNPNTQRSAIIGLNFVAHSDTDNLLFWDASSDGHLILYNSLRYVYAYGKKKNLSAALYQKINKHEWIDVSIICKK